MQNNFIGTVHHKLYSILHQMETVKYGVKAERKEVQLFIKVVKRCKKLLLIKAIDMQFICMYKPTKTAITSIFN